VIFRRGRFRELVDRQLDLFEADTQLLDEAAEADAAWSHANAEESEERYGEYQLVVDAIGQALYEIRETYAATLAADTADAYRADFDRAARKRFGRLAAFLEEDD
jgi:hypothetical protein